MRCLILAVRVSLVLFVCGILTLHLLPGTVLQATQGKTIPYDPRFNFLSEYARTQYTLLMEVNFLLLAATAASLARALWLTGLRREGWFLSGAGLFLVLLACFRTDLVDLRTDALTCGDPLRVEDGFLRRDDDLGFHRCAGMSPKNCGRTVGNAARRGKRFFGRGACVARPSRLR